MNFEKKSAIYLNNLIASGSFYSGKIVGVDEELFRAEAIVSIEKETTLFERDILIYKKQDDTVAWKVLEKTKKERDIVLPNANWAYPDFSNRIVLAIDTAISSKGQPCILYFIVKELPILNKKERVHLYFNIADALLTQVISELGDKATIQAREDVGTSQKG